MVLQLFSMLVKMVPACRKPVIKQGDWPVHVKKELRMQVEFLLLLDEILNLRLPMGVSYGQEVQH